MRIIRSYIIRECISPFVLALGVLTCTFLTGSLVRLTDLAIRKGVSIAILGKIFILYVPVFLGYTLPIACLVGVIVAFSRFSSDNEILALRASGFHIGRILTPLFIVGLILSLFSIVLNERIIPYASFEQRRMIKTLGIQNPTALLEPGMFIDSFDDQILFIHKIKDNKMYHVTIYQPQKDGPTRTIIAKEGEFTPVPGEDKIKLKLINGTSDEPDFENPDHFYKLNFENYFMTLDLSNRKTKVEKKPKNMSLKELKTEIEKLEKLFIDPTRIETEYYRKIAWSFAPLFFILLGFPIAVITNRREKSANIVLAMMFALTYYLLSLGCEALSINNALPAAFIMWVPNLTAGIAAIYFNFKCVS